MTPNDEVLNSWKEVATYLGRGVRTVQRWERELALPVRRPRGKSRSAVIAFKSELDQWLHHAPAEQLRPDHAGKPPVQLLLPNLRTAERQARLHGSTEALRSKTHLLMSTSVGLRDRLIILRQELEKTVLLTANKITRNVNNTASYLNVPPPRAGGSGQQYQHNARR